MLYYILERYMTTFLLIIWKDRRPKSFVLKDLVFAISLINVDKPPLDATTVLQRVKQFTNRSPIILMNTPGTV